MRQDTFKTGRVDIPEYFGGTYCDVIGMADRDTAKVYDHVMTPLGSYCLYPDRSWHKTPLDKEIDKALDFRLDNPPHLIEAGYEPWN